MTFYCPECGCNTFSFGSLDETEGVAYYWCSKCNYGPVKFPVGERPNTENAFTTVTRESDKLICKGNGKTCLCDPDHNPCGKTIAAILGSDRKDEALRIAALLKQRTRPIIIAEENVPGYTPPRDYLKEACDRINGEQEIIRKAVRTPDMDQPLDNRYNWRNLPVVR